MVIDVDMRYTSILVVIHSLVVVLSFTEAHCNTGSYFHLYCCFVVGDEQRPVIALTGFGWLCSCCGWSLSGGSWYWKIYKMNEFEPETTYSCECAQNWKKGIIWL